MDEPLETLRSLGFEEDGDGRWSKRIGSVEIFYSRFVKRPLAIPSPKALGGQEEILGLIHDLAEAAAVLEILKGKADA